ncbi:carboxymuconolactone decarboxylase family protein [Nocardioides sp. zg-536]|uniref:Carboxymuconolactone decarboxylase family protein n=1 Tax=Nocardioides faecalis TaxID=2803858 RepID=A0A939BW87_9ACTN|nr:carboxymuconolactone decarboxylase family protein [Nocardioides faecalis]MBM9460332.1 carboxymuconolactone decarboxylase family protein [Nocardioides faecalis]QVI59840.1 carboxymuconolactone decarboxylase family protein [Nocardioides faecalis]
MSVPEHRPLYLDKADPTSYAAAGRLAESVGAAAEAAGLSRVLLELVNIRVSQINGCAYCLDLHRTRALEAGEEERRLLLLETWSETELFTEEERAALLLAESITRLPEPEERRYAEDLARAVLGDAAYVAVCWAAIAINAFNRVSITSHHPVR